MPARQLGETQNSIHARTIADGVTRTDPFPNVIIERPSGAIAGIEVKASATVRAGDFRGLAHLRDHLGERLAAGIVLYAGERTLPFGPRL